MSYFTKLGIIGWEQIEPIILAAILSNKAVLFKAPHGANKTEGCRTISKAVFGAGSKFVPYDTSLVNADDLLGFLHPGKLTKGEIDYISTPDSIWDAESCLLDEINRCNPYNAAKFFEIVRARTINGRETALKFVWAACNPPDKYNTAHMDPAQVSRFVVLDVPSYGDLSAAQRKKILTSAGGESTFSLKSLMEKAAKTKVADAQERRIREQTSKIAAELGKVKDLEFSGRQVVDLFALLMNMDRVASSLDGAAEISEETLCDAVMGLVPEATGLIRSTVNTSAIRGEIATLMKGFKLSDPILTAENVVELARAKGKDMQGWAGALTDMVMIEEDTDKLDEAWKVLGTRKDLQPHVSDALRQSFAAKRALLNIPKGATIEEASTILENTLKTFGPKSATKTRKGNRNG